MGRWNPPRRERRRGGAPFVTSKARASLAAGSARTDAYGGDDSPRRKTGCIDGRLSRERARDAARFSWRCLVMDHCPRTREARGLEREVATDPGVRNDSKWACTQCDHGAELARGECWWSRQRRPAAARLATAALRYARIRCGRRGRQFRRAGTARSKSWLAARDGSVVGFRRGDG